MINSSPDLPDYYMNALIWYDEFSDDAMRWVIYDGLCKMRFPSESSAKRWIEEQHPLFLRGRKERLSRSAVRLLEIYQTIDKEADEMPELEKAILQRIALAIRKAQESLVRFLEIK